jgi:nondiscriminating aspartyl-tRNA synthetase
MGEPERIPTRLETAVVTSRCLPDHVGETVTVQGAVHRVRDVGGITFLVIRDREDLLQAVTDDGAAAPPEGAYVRITGEVVPEERAPRGVDLRVTAIELIAEPVEPIPIVINKRALNLSLHEKLERRPLALRHPRERAIFRIQAALAEGFRRFLRGQGFTEIRTPKIVSVGAEGGANLFELDYFGRAAYLAQSPQLYKQFMVGVYERVFEVGQVYRAEKHNTSRHLNEYVSLDLEMGFVRDHRDVMAMEAALLATVLPEISEECAEELALLEVELPEVTDIPALPLAEAIAIAERDLGRPVDRDDLDPEAEEAVSRHGATELGSEFVFVTHYPEAKRPFYALNDPDDPALTRSFDLLLRGLEVTTGGQRIHSYDEQVEKLRRFGLDPADFEHFLVLHRHGVPPHGGLAIGLERLTMKLLGFGNVREATLFPRDIDRLTP